MTTTSTLTLKTAIGGYGHFAAIKDGSVKADGVQFEQVEVTPIIAAFRRMCRSLEFDISEMAITTYMTARRYGLTVHGDSGFPGARLPSRRRRRTTLSQASRSRRTIEPVRSRRSCLHGDDGRLVHRGILADDYAVDLDKVNWILADEEHVEAFHKDAPSNATYQLGANLGEMLAKNELASNT